MRVERRRLPLQVKPLEGESIDSWLEATALAMDLTMGALAAAGGLPTTVRPSWRSWLSSNQALALAAATGLPTSSLKSMTLSRYDGLALSLDPEAHVLDPDFPFGPLSWSRFCPACIRVLTTVENQASRDGASSSQHRNTDGPLDANRATNRSAGQRSLRTMRGRWLSSCSTANRCAGGWLMRVTPLGK
jgi:hypothetical protein